MSDIATQYFIKAKENFEYNPEDAIEHIQYALSHDDQHPGALCLMGRYLSEPGINYHLAFDYFERALLSDAQYFDTYFHYGSALLATNQFEKARRIYLKALQVNGICISCVYRRIAMVYEKEQRYGIALNYLNIATVAAEGSHDFEFIEEVVSMIKKKKKLMKKLNE